MNAKYNLFRSTGRDYIFYLLAVALLCLIPACSRQSQNPLKDDATQPQNEQTVVTDNTEQQDQAVIYPPAPDLPPAPDTIRIAVISDINGSYGSVNYSKTVMDAVKDIVRRRADIVVSPGDLVAGQKAGLDYAAMWRSFHYNIADVFFDNNIEFIWAPGNHDASAYPAHQVERFAAAEAWKNRQPKAELLPGSKFPFYYAVNIRGVFIAALDITRPFNVAPEMLDWLDECLAQQADARARIVLGHMPLEPARTAQFWEVAGSPRLLEILQNRNVTFYISGHHHVYYPGHIGELRTLFAPALGSNPRSFDGGAPPVNAYVMIEIPPEGPPAQHALVAPDFMRMVNIQTLPNKLITIEREDLGMANYIIELLDRTVL